MPIHSGGYAYDAVTSGILWLLAKVQLLFSSMAGCGLPSE
jgi:hypothetical protein